MRNAALWILLSLTWPTLAYGQRAVVLAPHVEPTLGDAEREQLLQALERALRTEHIDPSRSSQTEACADQACQTAQRDLAQANQAVQLTIWRAADGSDTVGGVSVAVIDATGARYSEGAARHNAKDDVASLISQATHGAYERLRRGPGPWLELTGQPAGALVTIDGHQAGSLPTRYRVAGGLHHVVVTQAGFEPYDTTVTVPKNPDALKTIDVSLSPHIEAAVESDPDGLDSTATRASWKNYAIAGAAVGLGIALAIRPIRTGLDEGECGQVRDDRCTGTVQLDIATAVQLGIAAVLVAGGGTFALWAPLREPASDTSTAAGIPIRF